MEFGAQVGRDVVEGAVQFGRRDVAARCDHETLELREDRLEPVPARAYERIAAHDEREAVGRIARAQFRQEIRREPGRIVGQIRLIEGKSRIRGDRQAHHLGALLARGHRRRAVRAVPRRHEQHAIQIARLAHRLSHEQMPVVNRIEPAPENADILA